MIREQRVLLAELARLNTDLASVATRMMEGSVETAEQREFAQRLIEAGQRLHQYADDTDAIIDVDGEAALVSS